MAEQYNFEKFDGAVRRGPDVSTITFQKRKTVGVSGKAFRELGEPKAVTLHFDKKRRVMGIRAADPDEQGAILLRKQNASESYLFTGVAFATRYGIEFGDKALRFRAEPYGENMIIADLNQTPEDVTVTRRAQGEDGQHDPADGE